MTVYRPGSIFFGLRLLSALLPATSVSAFASMRLVFHARDAGPTDPPSAMRRGAQPLRPRDNANSPFSWPCTSDRFSECSRRRGRSFPEVDAVAHMRARPDRSSPSRQCASTGTPAEARQLGQVGISLAARACRASSTIMTRREVARGRVALLLSDAHGDAHRRSSHELTVIDGWPSACPSAPPESSPRRRRPSHVDDRICPAFDLFARVWAGYERARTESGLSVRSARKAPPAPPCHRSHRSPPSRSERHNPPARIGCHLSSRRSARIPSTYDVSPSCCSSRRRGRHVCARLDEANSSGGDGGRRHDDLLAFARSARPASRDGLTPVAELDVNRPPDCRPCPHGHRSARSVDNHNTYCVDARRPSRAPHPSGQSASCLGDRHERRSIDRSAVTLRGLRDRPSPETIERRDRRAGATVSAPRR